MKTLAEFKRALHVGGHVTITNQLSNTTEYRPVLDVHTNGIVTGHALTVEQAAAYQKDNFRENPVKVGGVWYAKRHLTYQKAKNSRVEGNTMNLLAFQDGRVMSPSPDFEPGETWLTVELES